MALLGRLWGSPKLEWKEWLHPRDKSGKFRTKGGAGKEPAFVGRLSSFLEGFNPRSFQSDGQVSQHLHNISPPVQEVDQRRMVGDWADANAVLNSGEAIDPSTQKFVDMMDRRMIEAPDDMLVNMSVGPEAFGLTPETMGLPDGGISDFPGALVASDGYTMSTMGSLVATTPITMSIAVPKGTRIAPTRRSGNDRGIALDRGQGLRITKVTPDGRGGYLVMAVADEPDTDEGPAVKLHTGGVQGRTPQEREARFNPQQAPSVAQAPRSPETGRPVVQGEERRFGETQAPDVNAQPGNTNTGPGGPPPRQEPVVTEAIGGPAQPSGAPPAGTPEAPAAPAAPAQLPDAPGESVREQDFRAAVREAGIPSPSEGQRRRQWNNAYLGIAAGKKQPADVLRELDKDIDVNERGLQRQREGIDAPDPELEADIDAQRQLASAIRKQFNLPEREGEAAPEAPTPTPEGPTPTPGAPSTARGSEPTAPAPAKKAAAPRKRAPAKKAAPAAKADEAAEVRDEAQALRENAIAAREGRLKRIREGRAGGTEESVEEDFQDAMRRADAMEAKAGPAKKAAPAKAASTTETDPYSRQGLAARAKAQGLPATVGELRERAKREGVPNYRRLRKEQLQFELLGPVLTPDDRNRDDERRHREARDRILGPTPAPDTRGGMTKEQADLETAWEKLPEAERQEVQSEFKSSDARERYTRWRENGSTHSQAMAHTRKGETPRAPRKAAAPRKAVPREEKKPKEPATGPNLNRMTKAQLQTEYDRRKGDGETLPDLPEKPTNDELRRALRGEAVQARPEKVPSTAEADLRRTRLKVARDHGDLGAEIQQLIEDDVDTGTLKSRIGATAERLGLEDFVRDSLMHAAEDKPRLKRQAQRMMANNGALELHPVGSPQKFDRSEMEGVGGANIGKGADVQVVRPGFYHEDDTGKRTVLRKAQVEEITPAEAARADVGDPKSAMDNPLSTKDRVKEFDEFWNSKARQDSPDSAAGRTIDEVVLDISEGRISVSEGIRRLENDIEINRSDLAEMSLERRKLDPDSDERKELFRRMQSLGKDIEAQGAASDRLRAFRHRSAETTPDEVKDAIQVDPDVTPDQRTLGERVRDMDAADLAEFDEQLKAMGLKPLEGGNGKEKFDDALKQIIQKEVDARAAKRAKPAAPKRVDAPKENRLPDKAESPYERLDVRTIGQGLEFTDEDRGMLDGIQALLDGDSDTLGKNPTPARVGRHLQTWSDGPGSPGAQRAYSRGIQLGKTDSPYNVDPEAKAQFDAEWEIQERRSQNWKKLADRLMQTRRQRKKERAPETEPEVTPDEKAEISRVADLTDTPVEELETKAVAKKRAAAPPKRSSEEVAQVLKTVGSRAEADDILKGYTKDELRDIAKAADIDVGSRDTKAQMAQKITQFTVGRRLDSDAISRLDLTPGARRGSEADRRQELMDAPLSDLVDLENELGIKRTSVDRADRVDAIMKNLRTRGDFDPEPEPPGGGGGRAPNLEVIQGGGEGDTERLRIGDFEMEGRPANPTPRPALRSAGEEDHMQVLADIENFDFENPPSRESVADRIKGFNKSQLVEMATKLKIPGPGRRTKPELQRQIVEATVGRRLDSIAIRGFTGVRPDSQSTPTPESPVEARRARLRVLRGGGEGASAGSPRPSLRAVGPEDERAARRQRLRELRERARADLREQGFEDPRPEMVEEQMKTLGEQDARDVTRSRSGGTPVRVQESLPRSGRQWNWETIKEDNMTMHGDSASMELAQRLQRADREEDAQYVADMRYRISNQRGEHSPDDVQKMVADLKDMRDRERSPDIRGFYDRALREMDAPESKAPDLPESTPAPLRQVMDELNQIPVARRTGHFAGQTRDKSAVQELSDLIRKVDAGEGGSVGSVASEIRRILRSFHESVDGGMTMWRLESLIDEGRGPVRDWVRSFYPK